MLIKYPWELLDSNNQLLTNNIKKKPINRIDLFFEYTKDMKERTLSIKTRGRLSGNKF